MTARTTTFRAGAAAALAALGACAAAETIPATPTTLAAALERAEGGDVVRLAPGDYGPVVLGKRTFAPRLRIEAAGARLAGVTLGEVEGVSIEGGTVDGPDMAGSAVVIRGSRDVAVSGMRITGARTGVSISRSRDVAVLDNLLEGLRSDGVNVAMSQGVRIERNSCRDFRPIPKQFLADGTMVKDGDHPDCIQGWSRRTDPPTADVRIIDNVADGEMQGVFFGDPGQGGYDRVVVRGNRFSLAHFHGIRLSEVRGAEVVGNSIRPRPGSRSPQPPHRGFTTWIRVDGSDLTVCGNDVPADPLREGTRACRAEDGAGALRDQQRNARR